SKIRGVQKYRELTKILSRMNDSKTGEAHVIRQFDLVRRIAEIFAAKFNLAHAECSDFVDPNDLLMAIARMKKLKLERQFFITPKCFFSSERNSLILLVRQVGQDIEAMLIGELIRLGGKIARPIANVVELKRVCNQRQNNQEPN